MQAAKSLVAMAPGARGAKDSGDQQLAGPLSTPGTIRDLATRYATIPRGGFLPAPQPPRPMQPGRAIPQVRAASSLVRAQLKSGPWAQHVVCAWGEVCFRHLVL